MEESNQASPRATAGPWTCEPHEALNIRDPDGGLVAQLGHLAGRFGSKGRRSAEEVAANARLIAAAPRLLELLKRAQPIIESDAQMMAVITRHSPLDYKSQSIHDSTETESEKLVPEIQRLLEELS